MDKEQGKHIIFGLGQSGLSCARYFDRIRQPYCLFDTRENPPGKGEVEHLKYCEKYFFGKSFDFELIDESVFSNCQQIVVSPGISLNTPFVKKAKDLKIDVCGDVEIFARVCSRPIIAITGSNGKSTVTDLTDKLLNAAGIKSQKGGNIGLPVLDFLPQDDADVYVLELSSFQLDTTSSLRPEVAVLLNISEDHLDRYANFYEYCQSKQRIYRQAKHSVFNFDEPLSYPKEKSENDLAFSILLEENDNANISRITRSTNGYDLLVKNKSVVSSDFLSITGKHNFANVLASLNILDCMNVEIDDEVLDELKSFKGLKHRFQLVSRENNCEWINDSKATNVGATIAALNSVESSEQNHLILIAGGDSKQSDLTPLIQPLEAKVSNMVLLGKDANLFAELSSKVTSYFVENMQQAVCKAKELVNGKTIILLSPACASLDMYKNFEERGDEFIAAVRAYG